MKSTLIFKAFTAILTVFILVSSCKKAEEIIENVSEEEAVEVVENSISSESGGLTQQIETSTTVVNYYNDQKNGYCGLSFDSTINIVNPSGSVITYQYNFQWDWMINCNGMQIPESIAFSYDTHGGYDAPRMSAEDSGSQSFELSGLDLSSNYWTYNGSYEREGYCQSKIGQMRSFTSKITFEALNVQVDKTTGKIWSGTANITFEAKTSEGKTFSYDGVLTFTGGDTATLKFENEYVIQL